MNLTKLFETQKILRDRIKYEGEDRFEKLILALLVELGECANEWRGFKFWSKNQEPKPAKMIGVELEYPLIEEYVDGLHFVLELGLEIGVNKYKPLSHKQETITNQFIELNYQTYIVLQRNEHGASDKGRGQWYLLFDMYLGLGEMLGFTWEEIEQAYYAKNAVNHQRQENGY